MFKTILSSSAAVVLLFSTAQSSAEQYVVTQNDKAFSTEELTVKVGDVVSFENEDKVAHNIFSLSDSKSFDLGSFANGEKREVSFDAPGLIEVECALHPDMYLEITVEE